MNHGKFTSREITGVIDAASARGRAMDHLEGATMVGAFQALLELVDNYIATVDRLALAEAETMCDDSREARDYLARAHADVALARDDFRGLLRAYHEEV